MMLQYVCTEEGKYKMILIVDVHRRVFMMYFTILIGPTHQQLCAKLHYI